MTNSKVCSISSQAHVVSSYCCSLRTAAAAVRGHRSDSAAVGATFWNISTATETRLATSQQQSPQVSGEKPPSSEFICDIIKSVKYRFLNSCSRLSLTPSPWCLCPWCLLTLGTFTSNSARTGPMNHPLPPRAPVCPPATALRVSPQGGSTGLSTGTAAAPLTEEN